MQSFNESLDLFLTACRENALLELKDNEQYAEWKNAQKELFTELETLISPEAQKILKTYNEKITDIQSMEANQIMVCGLTLTAKILKRFDTSTPEYKAFLKEFV